MLLYDLSGMKIFACSTSSSGVAKSYSTKETCQADNSEFLFQLGSMPNFDAASVRAKADELVRVDKANVEGRASKTCSVWPP